MYVVGVGLIKVNKALLRLARGALSVPLLMSMSEALPVPFHTLIKLCDTKPLEWSSLIPGLEAKSSEIMNLTPFTVSYQRQCRRHRFDPWVGRSRGEENATHSSILAWRIPKTEAWQGTGYGLRSMGLQRVGHDWEVNTFIFKTHILNVF